KPLVKRILDFAKSKGATITIVTNGVEAIDFIDILHPFKKDIDMLQITVDGPKEIHDSRRRYPSGKGSFCKISESIDALLKNNINTNVRVNIDNTNINHLPKLYQYVYEKGWVKHPNFSIKPSLVTDHSTLEYNDIIIPEEKLLEKLIKIYDQYPWLEELFGFYLFKPLRHILDIVNGAPNVAPRFVNCESNLIELNVFCPDGYIYVCPESIGNKEIAIGRFSPRLEFDLDKINIWKERTIAKMEKCCLCKFSPICGGGCTYSSILIFKKYNNPVCERFQEVLDTFIKLRGQKIFSSYLTTRN
ncbi:MAG: radical SAM protein, partial [Actinobacteria bacterium]|nr:radical SAM protein [Actinomycetota bacterium]